MQYLFQARDDDEHGLGEVVTFHPGHTAVGVAHPDFSRNFRLSNIRMEAGKVDIEKMESLDGKPILIKQIMPHTRLNRVAGRGSVYYDPPTSHLGEPIANSMPLTVANLAVAYLKALVCSAESRT